MPDFSSSTDLIAHAEATASLDELLDSEDSNEVAEWVLDHSTDNDLGGSPSKAIGNFQM